ncbi:MAG: hypothetical protein HUJ26_12640 [Planctomycetaceae bacterium]|nr:hypothetical protein [Planctomycetaceae bacterium]
MEFKGRKVEIGDWVEVSDTDVAPSLVFAHKLGWQKVEFLNGDYINGWHKSAITNHRSKSGPFKVGDIFHDRNSDEELPVTDRMDLDALHEFDGATLVKPVEAIEAEQKDPLSDNIRDGKPKVEYLASLLSRYALDSIPNDKTDSAWRDFDQASFIANAKLRIEEFIKMQNEKFAKFKAMVHGFLDDLGIDKHEDKDCRIKHRLDDLRRLINRENHVVDANKKASTITPIPGPPDLEGVPDDATVVAAWNDHGQWMIEWDTVENARRWDTSDRNMPGLVTLGVIEPPEPELPKCPHCKHECVMSGIDEWEQYWHFLACEYCGWESQRETSEQAAIKAAKGDA